MSKQSYFQNALSNFTHEVASGGAIRHLTDLGYTVKQIEGQLSFPTSFARIQKEVWQHLVDTSVILLEEPGSIKKEKAVYIREYDRYGRASFRRVVESEEKKADISWRRRCLEGEDHDALYDLICSKIEENGDDFSYVACDFGLLIKKEPERFQRLMHTLEEDFREYVEGLPWERQRVYHRLDGRMTKIWKLLRTNKGCFGECYFLKTGEIYCF